MLVDYLNEPDNTMPRAGAIALGTAAGYILGLRHGRIRRLLYTGIGGGALASLCYPQDAKVYGNRALAELKGVAKIGYNFAYGGKCKERNASFRLFAHVQRVCFPLQ